ncbi:hypothetical protein HN51_009273, partial [Arachis hypogaea]
NSSNQPLAPPPLWPRPTVPATIISHRVPSLPCPPCHPPSSAIPIPTPPPPPLTSVINPPHSPSSHHFSF